MYPFESTTEHAYRSLYNGSVSIRGIDGETPMISGLAIPYDKFTRITTKTGDVFCERIARGALKETLTADNVIECTVNHDEKSLGDTRSNLALYDRDDGLHFELKANNERALHLIDGVRKGFFDKCSFIFKKTDWVDEERGGMIWRTIKAMELYEISLVDSPAYKQTSAKTDNRGVGDSIRTAIAGSGVNIESATRLRY